MVQSSPRLLSKRASLLLLAFPVLILAGCSDSLTSAAPSPPTFANSNKGLEKTLTSQQRKAAIAELQSEQAKRHGEVQADTTASVKPAQTQN
jgi:hypothetical protein